MNTHDRKSGMRARSIGLEVAAGLGLATGLSLAVAAGTVALLAACGGEPETTRASTGVPPGAADPASTSASATTPDIPPLVSAGAQPTATATPSATSPSAPSIPPTAEETKAAWRDGVQQFDARDYEASAGSLQIAAAGRPDDARVHYLHGLALFKSGHLEEAEAALVRSSTLNGQSIRTWTNLARVRLARGDFQGGLDAAEQALAIDSGSADALHQRGRALEGMGRWDDALQVYEQAQAAAPDNGWIANSLGHLLLLRGRVDEAIPHLEVASGRLPTVGFVRNNLGVAYERRGDLGRAADEYRAAVDNGDPDGKAAASLARLEPLVGPVVASGRETSGDPAAPPQN